MNILRVLNEFCNSHRIKLVLVSIRNLSVNCCKAQRLIVILDKVCIDQTERIKYESTLPMISKPGQ